MSKTYALEIVDIDVTEIATLGNSYFPDHKSVPEINHNVHFYLQPSSQRPTWQTKTQNVHIAKVFTLHCILIYDSLT